MKFKTPEETQRQDLLRAAGTPFTQSCNRPSLGAPTPVAGGVAPGSLWGEVTFSCPLMVGFYSKPLAGPRV